MPPTKKPTRYRFTLLIRTPGSDVTTVEAFGTRLEPATAGGGATRVFDGDEQVAHIEFPIIGWTRLTIS